VLALETGMRWGEIRTLTWDRVRDLPFPHVFLERTKNGRTRRVPLNATAREALRRERARRPDSLNVSPITGKNPCIIQQRSGTAELKDNPFHWTYHQLRHTYASRFIEAGGSLAVLQSILGHSTIRMTERYARLSDSAMWAEIQRLEQLEAAPQPATGKAK